MRLIEDLHPEDAIARDQLATRLVQARASAGLTQRELGDRLGVDFHAVYNLERGRRWLARRAQAWARGLDLRLGLRVQGLEVPDDDDALAALYAAQQPMTAEAEDRLALRELFNNLARIRRARHVSQKEMGRRMGLGPTRVSQQEAEPDGALLLTAQRYTRALGGVLLLDLLPVMVAELEAA